MIYAGWLAGDSAFERDTFDRRHSGCFPPRLRLRSWTVQDFGLRIRNRLCHSHHSRPSIRLLSRHASCHRLCGVPPSTAYARRQFRGTVVRTFGFMATALICSAFIHHVDHAWSFAIRVGLVTGIVTGVGATVNPYIEYYADNLPERRLGAFGIGLILCGFALQSLQYWLHYLMCV